MRFETASGQDWRDEAAYAPLFGADRSLFAWEWLRRDPLYRSTAERGSLRSGVAPGAAPGPQAFGLVAFEPPDLRVPDARPLWRSDVHPYVLGAELARGCAANDAFEIESMQGLARTVASDQKEHLLLSDGLRVIRLDAPPGVLGNGATCLCYRLGGLEAAERPLLTLRRFLALCRNGRFSIALHRPEPRARRWVLMLRAFDALAVGADQREIAQELFSRSVAAPRWRSREPSVRSQVQRLVGCARRMAGDGYRELLK